MNRFMAQIWPFRSPGNSAIGATALLLCVATMAIAAEPAAPPATAPAATTPAAPRPVYARIKVRLESRGDAQVMISLHNLSDKFDAAKSKSPAFVPFMLNRLRLDRSYFEPQDVNVLSAPDISGYRIEYKLPGLGRPRADGTWDAPILAEMPRANLEKVPNGIVLTDASAGTSMRALGIQQLTITIDNSREIKRSEDGRRLSFHIDLPPIEKGSAAKGEFHLSVRPRIMACLAKSYGNDRFQQLWVGRSSFTNTGSAVLDYSVRFRLGEYSPDWSPWSRCTGVVPGQTVVDPYFPLLGIEKMARIEGNRQAQVDAEYEFKTADGKVVTQTDSQRIQILGHNDLILDDDCLDMVLASFTTKDDPIVRRIAGFVVGQVPGGINAASSNEGAIKFMEQLYRFMLHNHVSYQTPPGEGKVQHVKYCREVILNRAGTCIDLAIFYASVCEAVGLEPVLILPEGHCFPAIWLPEKKDEYGKPTESHPICAIETTLLKPGFTFASAHTRGMAEVKELLSTGTVRLVDIEEMRARGVDSMELPAVADNLLDTIGISAAPPFQNIEGSWVSTLVDGGKELKIEAEFTKKAATIEIHRDALAGGVGEYEYDGSTCLFTIRSPDGKIK